MRIRNLAAAAGALLLLGPAAGVGMAEEKPAGPAVGARSASNNSWLALSGVQAIPMDAVEMDAVKGKVVEGANIFLFLDMFGTPGISNGANILFWSSAPLPGNS